MQIAFLTLKETLHFNAASKCSFKRKQALEVVITGNMTYLSLTPLLHLHRLVKQI